MKFSEKLKQLRAAEGLTQAEFASSIGVTTRTLQNYESGRMYPKQSEIYGRIAALTGVTADYLLSEQDAVLSDAQNRGGIKARRDLDSVINETCALFAGGELNDDEMDAVMRSLTEAYWDAKEKSKKYTPKKYLKQSGKE